MARSYPMQCLQELPRFHSSVDQAPPCSSCQSFVDLRCGAILQHERVLLLPLLTRPLLSTPSSEWLHTYQRHWWRRLRAASVMWGCNHTAAVSYGLPVRSIPVWGCRRVLVLEWVGV